MEEALESSAFSAPIRRTRGNSSLAPKTTRKNTRIWFWDSWYLSCLNNALGIYNRKRWRSVNTSMFGCRNIKRLRNTSNMSTSPCCSTSWKFNAKNTWINLCHEKVAWKTSLTRMVPCRTVGEPCCCYSATTKTTTTTSTSTSPSHSPSASTSISTSTSTCTSKSTSTTTNCYELLFLVVLLLLLLLLLTINQHEHTNRIQETYEVRHRDQQNEPEPDLMPGCGGDHK